MTNGDINDFVERTSYGEELTFSCSTDKSSPWIDGPNGNLSPPSATNFI